MSETHPHTGGLLLLINGTAGPHGRRPRHSPAPRPHHQTAPPALHSPAGRLDSRRPGGRPLRHRTLRHRPALRRRLRHRVRHGRHPRPCRDHHRPRYDARRDPRSQRRRRGVGVPAAEPVRREEGAPGDGADGPDLRHPRLLRRRHLRPRADRVRRRQAVRQVDPPVLPAPPRRPLRHPRLPAAAPRPGRRRRPPARRPRLGHPHGRRLRTARRGRRLGVVGVDRQTDLRPRTAGHAGGGRGGQASGHRRTAHGGEDLPGDALRRRPQGRRPPRRPPYRSARSSPSSVRRWG